MEIVPVLFPDDWQDYALLDCGQGEKLERFGTHTLIRPDPRAIWFKTSPANAWRESSLPSAWKITYHNLTFILRPPTFRHVGVFPEQAVNWNWLEKTINHAPLNVLNLFAYTGGATLATALAGARVTHVDSSRPALSWARENAEASHLAPGSVRWLEDDAYKFVAREIRRGVHYDGIILDPPRFGHGSKGEIWKLQDDLSKLLLACRDLLNPSKNFLLLNAYTADLSAIALHQLISDLFPQGQTTASEIGLMQEHSPKILPAGISVRHTQSL